ncbi:MAG: sigma-70 family RNA polymerase sigma factor [Bacteroidales bacterium]|nr:sigma-70 family RNA polymerase sigma factor [Bacteroidales bacterium]
MTQIPDKKIIRGILEHKSLVINYIYSEFFPMIERMVVNSGGNTETAKDIFQEGLVIIYRRLKKSELVLCCKFSTYLYSICKKIWIQEKRKQQTRMAHQIITSNRVEEPEVFVGERIERIRKFFFRHFNKLSDDCRKILILHINEISIEEIQKIMDYKNSHYVMDRKYRCKKSLIQRILNDPEYKIVKNEYFEQIRSIL